MASFHSNFPQAPRDRTVALVGPLAFPAVAPLAPLTLRSKVLDSILDKARPSSIGSLDRLCMTLSGTAWQDGAAYPGLRDELEPYLDDPSPDDKSAEVAKVRSEFAVYSRMIERLPPIDTLNRAGFIQLALEVHRRLGTGSNSLRDRAVFIRPDAAGNKVVFPHHRHCPALLGHLHDFICRHGARYPALCATVAYAATIHAHPFNDGNGRTARTLYNIVLTAGAGTRHFVPIHLIAALHRGSFLIKLRRALYDGDWDGLQAFFCDAGRMSERLQWDSARFDAATGLRSATAPAAASGPDHSKSLESTR